MKLFNTFFTIILFLTQTNFIIAQTDSSNFQVIDELDNSKIETSNFALEIDSSKINEPEYITDKVSQIPSLEEVNNLFFLAEQGERDPAIVTNEISQRMDNAIPSLKQFFLKTTEEMHNTSNKKKMYAKGKYGVYVLGAIGTQKARELMSDIALTHPDKEVRGLAVNILARNFYSKVESDSLEPDKELLHVLLKSADDTTYVKVCENRIGDIAREGIKNWTGEDYGNAHKKNNRNPGTNFNSYNEQWWQNNSIKVKWNRSAKRFIVR